MEGNNSDAYGYPATQTNLVNGTYPLYPINPRTVSMDLVVSQTMDTGFQTPQTNTPTEIVHLETYTQNYALTGNGNPSQAKKRRAGHQAPRTKSRSMRHCTDLSSQSEKAGRWAQRKI